MKRMLLILMVLASATMAGDRQMKALLVGTWDDVGTTVDSAAGGQIFRSDGYWTFKTGFHGDQVDEHTDKWDIKGGKLIEIRPGGESARYYTILLLTKHEFLARETAHTRGYIFLTRDDD
jgi:hypothetical protein